MVGIGYCLPARLHALRFYDKCMLVSDPGPLRLQAATLTIGKENDAYGIKLISRYRRRFSQKNPRRDFCTTASISTEVRQLSRLLLNGRRRLTLQDMENLSRELRGQTSAAWKSCFPVDRRPAFPLSGRSRSSLSTVAVSLGGRPRWVKSEET